MEAVSLVLGWIKVLLLWDGIIVQLAFFSAASSTFPIIFIVALVVR